MLHLYISFGDHYDILIILSVSSSVLLNECPRRNYWSPSIFNYFLNFEFSKSLILFPPQVLTLYFLQFTRYTIFSTNLANWSITLVQSSCSPFPEFLFHFHTPSVFSNYWKCYSKHSDSKDANRQISYVISHKSVLPSWTIFLCWNFFKNKNKFTLDRNNRIRYSCVLRFTYLREKYSQVSRSYRLMGQFVRKSLKIKVCRRKKKSDFFVPEETSFESEFFSGNLNSSISDQRYAKLEELWKLTSFKDD